MPEKELLLNDIRRFVGSDGCIAIEHGYRPVFNLSMITGRKNVFTVTPRVGRPYPLEALEAPQLKDLIVELFRYRLFCELDA